MARTSSRPVPSGRIDREAAFTFGMWLSGLAVVSLGVLVNYLSAALLAFTIFFYAVIYTIWLKRRTAQNIVIGGAAGALPPVVGWAAATGEVSLFPVLLFAIIFLWTPPHFWALALVKSDEYTAARVPMLPAVAGQAATKRQILIYAVLLAAATLLPFVFGFAGLVYLVGVVLLNAVFLGLCVWLARARPTQADRAARAVFAASIVYLFLVFALLLV